MARKKHARPVGAEELQLSRGASAEYFSDRLRSRKRKTIVTSILAALAVVLVGGTIAVAAFVNDINTKITGSVNQNLLGELKPQEAGKPFYLLLIGIDKDEGRINDPSYGKDDSGYRSDSIMLTRIDPSEKKVTMVSIHRDTLYDFGEYGQQKINAAYTIGQEAFTTKTISDFADVDISHYAEVDMDGLAAVIDVIGGIDVTVDMDIKDPNYTGLDLKKGTHHLDGHTAALYCRCRHAYDALGDGDRYRAANQRMVISTVARKILSSDPATIAATVSTAASYVRTDMDVQSIISLAMQFIGMDFENGFYMGMEPTTAKYINATWFELCDVTAWRKMMHRVDQGLPPTEEGDVDPLETSPDTGMDDGLTYDTGESQSPYTYYDDGDDGYYYQDQTDYGGYDEGYDDGGYTEPSYEEEPAVEPQAEEPAYEEPSTPTEPEPVTEEPVVEEPVIEQPVIEEPVVTQEAPAAVETTEEGA